MAIDRGAIDPVAKRATPSGTAGDAISARGEIAPTISRVSGPGAGR
jgi:hypothetical protein